MFSTLKKRHDEIRTYLRYWVRGNRMPTKKFFIFTHCRSGSNLFVDLLNSHHHIHCDYEIFLEFVHLRNPIVFFPHWYIQGKACRIHRPVYGFKFMSDQLRQILINSRYGEPHDFLKVLHDHGWKILHLKRVNIFRKAVSTIVARETNRWHSKDGDQSAGKVTIDPAQLIGWMKWYDEAAEEEERMLKDIPHMSVVYEEDLIDARKHQKTMDAVYAYLEVPSRSVTTQWRRTNPDKLSEILNNDQEIYEAVRQTSYARFLPEGGAATSTKRVRA